MKESDSLTLKANFSFIENTPTDFEIRVPGGGIKSYKVHLCVASAYSLKIRTLSLCDPIRRTFEFPGEDPQNFFGLIIKFMYGYGIHLTNENVHFLNDAAAYLEIYSLLEQTSQFIEKFALSPGVFNKLKNAKDLAYVYPEIAAVVHNFDYVKNMPEIFDLPVPVFDAIFSSSDFSQTDDTEFYIWLNKLIEKHKGEGYEQLFSYLLLDYLDPCYVHAIRQRLTTDMVGGALWRTLCRRLLCRVVTQEEAHKKQSYSIPRSSSLKPKLAFPKHTIPATSSMPAISSQSMSKTKFADFTLHHHEMFNGIFAGLIRRTGKNPCTAQLVDISGGGSQKERFLPKLFDYNDLDTWWNNYNSSSHFKKEDQWINITFKRQEVTLTGYTFSSHTNYHSNSQPKSWRIYGSKNGRNWVVIDEVLNNEEMNKQSSTVYFKVKAPKGPFSYFKIEQLANHNKNTSSDQYEFCLNAIEFFGYIADL